MKIKYRLYIPTPVKNEFENEIYTLREAPFGDCQTMVDAEALANTALENYREIIILPIYTKN